MKNTIIFDMDGTLVDSGDVIANTINHVRQAFALEPLEKHHLLSNVNNPSINPSLFFYHTPTFTLQHRELFESYYQQHCISDLSLYDGIFELVHSLHNDYRLCVATNAASSFANKMLKHVGLLEYFDYVVGADMVKAPKPQPDMIYAIQHKIQSKKYIMVGDSKKDELAATAANIPSLMVNWGFSTYENSISDTETLYQSITRLV